MAKQKFLSYAEGDIKGKCIVYILFNFVYGYNKLKLLFCLDLKNKKKDYGLLENIARAKSEILLARSA